MIDLTVSDALRGKALADMFLGICSLLNHRAGRLLSVGDIADLVEWVLIGCPDDARLDSSIAYGHPAWGWFVRRETDTAELDDARPFPTRATRTLVCHVRPDRDDLDAVLVHAARAGYGIGICNAVEAGRRVKGFKAASTDKASLLPQYGTCRRVDLDLAGVADREAHWDAIRLVSRSMMRDRPALPSGLQSAWYHQDDFRRTFGLSISGTTANRDHRNHALYHAIKIADVMRVAQPQTVTCGSSASYADMSVGQTIRVSVMSVPGVVDRLLKNWDGFVGATFQS